MPIIQRLSENDYPFADYNGKDINFGDTFYYVPKSLDWINSCYKSKPQPEDSFIYFSTKEAAEEYVLMNKPCLNITDILNDYDSRGWGMNDNYKAQLIQLVKTKLFINTNKSKPQTLNGQQ